MERPIIDLYVDMLTATDLATKMRRSWASRDASHITRGEEHRLLDCVSRIANDTGQSGRRVWLHIVEQNFDPRAT